MRSNRSVYKPIINKILIKTAGIIVLMIICLLGLYSIGRGNISGKIVEWIGSFYKVEIEVANIYYWRYVRGFLDYILIFIGICLLILFFRAFLRGFTKYFEEIISGIDKLDKMNGKTIKMSPELKFVEHKLNTVKSRLEESTKLEKEIEKRKSDLIVYLAHDIKTPLTSVIGYLNLLEDNPTMDIETRSKYMNITLEKAYRLENLINEFFEITRYTLQTVPLNIEKIDLNYMLVQIVDELYPLLNKMEKTIVLDIEEDIKIKGDPEKLARVFNNLLKNAINYSVKKSEIRVYVKEDKNIIKIYFENKGFISKEDFKNIFEKFYRVDKARQSETGGFGLGLAITRDIVNLHGGNISGKSNEEKVIFKITIPK